MNSIVQSGLASISNAISNQGLRFQSGPFTICLTSNIKSIPEHIFNLYRENKIVDDNEFIDYHIRINRSKGLRRWIKPQVVFSLDGFKPFTPLPLNQATAQFEWGLNWCIASQAHQYLIIHSAVVEKNGASLILPGAPGSGKSTLCAGLITKGWRLLSDEMALVSIQNKKIYPVPRPVSLKNKSIKIINDYGRELYFGKLVRGTTKGDISHLRAPDVSVHQQQETATPTFIIFPKYSADSATELVKKSNAEACMALIKNTFNFNILGTQGFETVSHLIEQSNCFDFKYPDLDHAIEKVEQLVLKASD